MTERICVVAGAAGALGRHVVERLAADGWRVVAVHRSAEPPPFPEAVVPMAGDLGDPSRVEEIARAVAEMGEWWGAISCVGGFAVGRAHEMEEAALLAQLELNLLGPWRLAKAAARAMRGRGGRIVLTVGRAAVEPAPGQAAYQISKVACARLVEVMARELRDDGVTVNAVLPSVIDTPANRFAMPSADHSRWVPPQRIAAAIAWFLTDDAAEVSGALLPVYGRA